MKYFRALWAAILVFLAALKKETVDDIREARERQAELQKEIDEVPDKTDSELTDTAIDLGLVRPDGAGGTGNPTD